MRYYVYYTCMFGRALWGSYESVNEAHRQAALCRRRYRFVTVEEQP